jgi:AraC-like DNA-binding protein
MRAEPRLLSLPMTDAYYRLIGRRFGGALGEDFAAPGNPVPVGAGEIPVGTQLRQLAALQRSASPRWGLELGAMLDVITHGPSGLVAVTAPTLADALDAVARYMTVRTPFVDLRATRHGGRYALTIVEPCRLGPVRIPLLEVVLLSLQWTIESALGGRLDDARFTMPAARAAYWQSYEAFFHAPVTFAGASAGVSVPEQWLSLPCPLADPVAHRSTRARLESLHQRLEGDWIDAEVERLLASGGDPDPPIAAVAAALRVSERTLVRRLGRRHTSYRALRDDHRRALATELLAQPGLAVADVAARLGYADATNFARACRRWFGVSPRRYRSRGGDDSGE